MRRRATLLWPIAALLYGFMYLPIMVVIVFSFNSAKHGGPWRGFTTDWYARLFDNPDKLLAVKNTIVLGLSSTAVATILGTLLGYGLSRYRLPGKGLFSLMMFIPVVIPDVVMAVAMLSLYSMARTYLGLFELGMTTMVIAHITFQIPFVAIVVRSRLAGMDASIEEAAHDLGATTWRTFMNVTLPLIMPGVLAGAMLAFTLSLDDFVVSFFTTGPGATTLPILIYSSVKRGITPDINALSSLIVAASVVGVVGMAALQRPRRRVGG